MLIKGSRNENEGRKEDFGETRRAILEIKEFKAVANKLFNLHYGIDVSDTMLINDSVVASYIASETRPYQAVNDWADEVDLERTDIQGIWGMPAKNPLLPEHEDTAIATLRASTSPRSKPSGPGL